MKISVKCLGICIGVLFMGLFLAEGAEGASVNFSNPSLRSQVARDLQNKSLTQRQRANTWAQTKGASTQFEMEGVYYQLMSLKDGRPVYYCTYTDQASISIGVDRVRDNPLYGLDGDGLTIGLWDASMPRPSHQEFQNILDRIMVRDDFASGFHATAMASVIGAAGVDPRATGMAPRVRIDSYNWENDLSEMALRGASFSNEPGTIYVSSHSYGMTLGWVKVNSSAWAWLPPLKDRSLMPESGFGRYDEESAELDRIASLAPYYLIFFSAGNDRDDKPKPGDQTYFSEDGDRYYPIRYFSGISPPPGDGEIKDGYDTLGPMAVAKNVMTVGAVLDAVLDGARDPNQAGLTTFSGWGPTDDGRIKPDIVANGHHLYAAGGGCDSCYDDDLSGTSLSCPSASGAAMLVIQHYENLFTGQAMRSSTLKGLLLHAADDIGNPGPDYSNGWGLLNIEAAVVLLDDHANEDKGPRLVESLLSGSSSTAVYRTTCDGSNALRITLCWTDPEGPERVVHDDRNPCLVNDLDLRIFGPNGVGTHYPYVLDPNTPAAVASTGDNRLDNVEQIFIPSPLPGEYEIQVHYKGALSEGQQWYSLISNQTLEPVGDIEPKSFAWMRQVGGAESDIGYAVAGDEQGSVYIAGSTASALFGEAMGGIDAFITKYNAQGLMVWSQQLGTQREDVAQDVAIDSPGNAYVVGYRGGTSSGIPVRDSDSLFCKYDPDGHLLWQRSLDTVTDWHKYDDMAKGVTVDHQGNVYVTGVIEKYRWRAENRGGVFLARYDADGNNLWMSESDEDLDGCGNDVATDARGDIYIVGVGDGKAFLVKYNPEGTRLWRKSINSSGADEANAIAIDSEGNVYVTGGTWGSFDATNFGWQDIFLCKYDSNGNRLWARQLGSPYKDWGNGISVTPEGTIYVAGMAGGALSEVAHGSQDMFIGKYSADGTLLDLQQIGTKGKDQALGVSTDALGNVFITGYTWGSLGRSNFGREDLVLANVINGWSQD